VDDVVGVADVVLISVEVTTVVSVVVVEVRDDRSWVTVVGTETIPVTVTGTLEVTTGTPVTLTGAGCSVLKRPATITAATRRPPANPARMQTAVDPRLRPNMSNPLDAPVTQLTR
jgi:hypothetical protein